MLTINYEELIKELEEKKKQYDTGDLIDQCFMAGIDIAMGVAAIRRCKETLEVLEK